MLTENSTAQHSLSVFMSFKCCWLGSICHRRRLGLKSNSLKTEDYRPIRRPQGVLERDYLRSLLMRPPQLSRSFKWARVCFCLSCCYIVETRF